MVAVAVAAAWGTAGWGQVPAAAGQQQCPAQRQAAGVVLLEGPPNGPLLLPRGGDGRLGTLLLCQQAWHRQRDPPSCWGPRQGQLQRVGSRGRVAAACCCCSSAEVAAALCLQVRLQ